MPQCAPKRQRRGHLYDPFKASEAAVSACNRTSCRRRSASRGRGTSASASAAGCTAPTISGSWWNPSALPTTTDWSWIAVLATIYSLTTGWRFTAGWRPCGGSTAGLSSRRRRHSGHQWPGQRRRRQIPSPVRRRLRRPRAPRLGGCRRRCCHPTRCRLCTGRCDSRSPCDPNNWVLRADNRFEHRAIQESSGHTCAA